MPAYKYTLKSGKTLWYANFYYTDWTGEKKHICKRGFKTQREAKDYERSFLDQQSSSSDILFSSLVANYLEVGGLHGRHKDFKENLKSFPPVRRL